MALHKVDKVQNKLQLIKPSSFTDQKWHERRDLQPLLRDDPESISSELFMLSEEFGNWEGSLRRIDLLGLDKDANLVVIELKRQEDVGHMELQALRYAAMVSAMDFEAVVNAHEQFLLKLGKDPTNARQSIKDFLELQVTEEGIISTTPRIVLIAPSFSSEITTTVLWLNNQGLNIRCVEANLYNLDGIHYLDIEQIIPLPAAAAYQIKIRDKDKKAKIQIAKRQKTSLDILIEHGLIREGTCIHLIRSPRKGLELSSIEENAKYATFDQNSGNFKWKLDGNHYSLTSLCNTICEKHGISSAGSFQGPLYWAFDGDLESLYDKASKLSKVDANGVDI
ncbi:MAG: hypothetical protein RBJ76_14180 [Stenomitos frigidus ULC029]